MNRPTKIQDVATGSGMRPFWIPNNILKPGETVLLMRKHKQVTLPSGRPLFADWTHNCWTGRYHGYGRDAKNRPLFRTLKNALRFAQAAYDAGYRMKDRNIPERT